MPVYNGGQEIIRNVGVIRAVVAEALPEEEIELIVVSDGSIDGTDERLLEARSDLGARVIHYDRNLGKGYAVKTGALASAGAWIATIDADLDLDPRAIPKYVAVAREQQLDFAIGSKRHPESVVHYPPSRRIASWCYQQLNRVLFGLNVHDTQVGLKVFSRDVANDVVPLLLVKAFAFDVELLAVANALGYGRIAELPVRLEYRFTGSEVRSRAVARALWDTAAVFYRLRVLRTYQRKQRLLSTPALPAELPLVTLVGDNAVAENFDYPRLETAPGTANDPGSGDVIAIVAPVARPAANWLSAGVPYFSNRDVAAVVTPVLTPPSASLLERAAAAVLESRLGGGSRRSRYFPGNIGILDEYSGDTLLVRRADFVAARWAGVEDAELVSWLAGRGRRTVYTPDAIVSEAPAGLFLPHLRATFRHASVRGSVARRTKGASVSRETTLSLAPAGAAVSGSVLATVGPRATQGLGVALVAAYAAVVLGSAGLAALRFRSLAVGLLAAPALVATQATYVAGVLRGLLARA